MHAIRLIILFLGFHLVSGVSSAQDTERDSSLQELVMHAENRVEWFEDGVDSLRGEVVIEHEGMYLYCDTAIVRNKNFVLAYGSVAVLQSDSLEIFCDTMKYWADTGLSDLIGHVVMDNDGKFLKSERVLYDTKTRVANYNSESILRDSTALLRSEKGIYYLNQDKIFFRKNVQIIDTEFTMKTDSLIYNTEIRTADFFGATRINQDSLEVYCEEGSYDINRKKAVFKRNVQFLKKDEQGYCQQMVYDGHTDEYIFEGDAVLFGEEKEASGDQIIYNEQTESVVITGNAFYKKGDKQAQGGQLMVDGTTGQFQTIGRSTIVNKNTELKGEETSFDDISGEGRAIGNVAWIDTSSKVIIYCDDLLFNREQYFANIVGGEEKPLFVNFGQEDTLFISADTLLQRQVFSAHRAPSIDTIPSGTISEMDTMSNKVETAFGRLDTARITIVTTIPDTLDLFIGDNDVRIFGTNFQGLADSMVYNTTDSILILMDGPIMWSDSSQFKADTISLYMSGGKIDKAKMRGNSFITMMSEEGIFDQIKGRDIDVFFEDDVLYSLEVFTQGETLYFVKDKEDKFIGANTTQCNDIIFFFEEKELSDIKYIANPKSKLQPMDKIDPLTMRLEGFSWEIDQKPNNSKQIRQWNL